MVQTWPQVTRKESISGWEVGHEPATVQIKKNSLLISGGRAKPLTGDAIRRHRIPRSAWIASHNPPLQIGAGGTQCADREAVAQPPLDQKAKRRVERAAGDTWHEAISEGRD